MQSCTIEIITENGGDTSRFFAEATFARTQECESVLYSIDGDEGEFSFRDDGCAMRRSGKNGMRAQFRENEETELLLQSESFTGSVPVRTNYYRLHKERDGRRIELSYNFSGSPAVAEYTLHIHIKFFSEEK